MKLRVGDVPTVTLLETDDIAGSIVFEHTPAGAIIR